MGPTEQAMIAAKTALPPKRQRRRSNREPLARSPQPKRTHQTYYSSDGGCTAGTSCEFSHAGKGGAAAKGAAAKGGGKKRARTTTRKKAIGKGAVALATQDDPAYFAFARDLGSDSAPDDGLPRLLQHACVAISH